MLKRTIHRGLHGGVRCSSAAQTVQQRTAVKPVTEIPGPVAFPVIGNLLHYKFGLYDISHYHLVLREIYYRYGPIARQILGSRFLVHVFEPEDARTLYASEDKMPTVPPLQETIGKYRSMRSLSLGLGFTNGEEWYRLRNAVKHMMLRVQSVRNYLPLIEGVADDFVGGRLASQRRSDGTIAGNLRDEVSKWSLESAGMLCFERRLGCLSAMGESWGQRMVQANREIFVLSGQLKFSLRLHEKCPSWVPETLFPKWKRVVEAEDFFHGETQKLVDSAVAEVEEGSAQQKNLGLTFISYLLSQEELSKKDVAIITQSLFGDGLSTTTPAVLFNLFCLATHPEAQDRARAEVLECVPDQGRGPVTPGVVDSMSYLKNCVKETFRLFPIGTEVSRTLDKDLVLSGYEVPKGTDVDLNMSVHFRDPEIFPDPQSFRPERWSRGEEGTARGVHPYLLTPFGTGPRMCAGRRFAEQDLYTLLAKILTRFRLVYPDDAPKLGQVYQTLLFPDQEDLRIQFLDR